MRSTTADKAGHCLHDIGQRFKATDHRNELASRFTRRGKAIFASMIAWLQQSQKPNLMNRKMVKIIDRVANEALKSIRATICCKSIIRHAEDDQD